MAETRSSQVHFIRIRLLSFVVLRSTLQRRLFVFFLIAFVILVILVIIIFCIEYRQPVRKRRDAHDATLCVRNDSRNQGVPS